MASHFWDTWPTCFKCDRNAFRVRVSDNRLVCRDHESTDIATPKKKD